MSFDCGGITCVRVLGEDHGSWVGETLGEDRVGYLRGDGDFVIARGFECESLFP